MHKSTRRQADSQDNQNGVFHTTAYIHLNIESNKVNATDTCCDTQLKPKNGRNMNNLHAIMDPVTCSNQKANDSQPD